MSMRTTLEIDDVVLSAVKILAKEQGLTIGQVVSRLAQQALGPDPKPGAIRNGVPLFVPKAATRRSDLALVNSLRDDG